METDKTTSKKSNNPIRPDPLFKDITRKAALAAGLKLLDIELPQLLLADLVLAVPQDTDLSNTLFDFLAPNSIVDFKSENDTFDKFELARNLSRTLLFFSESQQVEYSQLLTVFVCSERPDSVINHLNQENIKIEIDVITPWLLRCMFGPLRIAIVVCRLLPLEKRYYDWLLFAPASSIKWREFVKMLIRNGERTLLEQVKSLRLKEFRLMTINIAEELKGLSAEERMQREKDWLDLIQAEIDALEKLNPVLASEVVSKMNPETLINGFTPEQRRKLRELLNQPDNPPTEEN